MFLGFSHAVALLASNEINGTAMGIVAGMFAWALFLLMLAIPILLLVAVITALIRLIRRNRRPPMPPYGQSPNAPYGQHYYPPDQQNFNQPYGNVPPYEQQDFQYNRPSRPPRNYFRLSIAGWAAMAVGVVVVLFILSLLTQ